MDKGLDVVYCLLLAAWFGLLTMVKLNIKDLNEDVNEAESLQTNASEYFSDSMNNKQVQKVQVKCR